jgi:crotonobetainyl-CoA:carnitine CoA-transferase CaiB-like acyl-CoA transferase
VAGPSTGHHNREHDMTTGPSIERTWLGLRVIDVSTNLAGPLATMVLGDLGADVIKVERPGGEDSRLLGPFLDGESTVYQAMNRGKRSIELDLRDREGHRAYLDLVATADVVVDSFGPGVAERLDVTYEDLVARNDRLVYCHISAFGDGDRGRSMPGYDGLVQAVSGIMSMTGEPDGHPARMGPAAIDLSTGQWAVIAIQAALARQATWDGPQRVDCALIDTALSLVPHQALATLATGIAPHRAGSSAPTAAPNEVFTASDGHLMVATANDNQFRRLCDALDRSDLAADPRYASMGKRVAARRSLHAELEASFSQRDVSAWCELLGQARVPCGPVQDLAEALGSPLVHERSMVVQAEGSDGRTTPQLRLPFDTQGRCVVTAPPRLGEHGSEILAELGYGTESVERLAGLS